LRPGRFDKVIFIDFPSAKERADILHTITKVSYLQTFKLNLKDYKIILE